MWHLANLTIGRALQLSRVSVAIPSLSTRRIAIVLLLTNATKPNQFYPQVSPSFSHETFISFNYKFLPPISNCNFEISLKVDTRSIVKGWSLDQVLRDSIGQEVVKRVVRDLLPLRHPPLHAWPSLSVRWQRKLYIICYACSFLPRKPTLLPARPKLRSFSIRQSQKQNCDCFCQGNNTLLSLSNHTSFGLAYRIRNSNFLRVSLKYVKVEKFLILVEVDGLKCLKRQNLSSKKNNMTQVARRQGKKNPKGRDA